MCTAATYQTKDFYFGRNLDYEISFHEEIAITPRNYPFHFRETGCLASHYAMIGMATMAEGTPLYYDATNEKGLSMAGLNFPGNAVYQDSVAGKDNVASFEFIPWILSLCATLSEAKTLLDRMNMVNTPFSEAFPPSPLHWIIADRSGSLTVESVADGLKVYDNPTGVLTNNPPFETMMFQLNQYMGLSIDQPANSFSDKLPLKAFSRGMGSLGLPGDPSSVSRFVKAVFVKMNSVSGDSESESISQFFHILDSVEQQKGCVHMGKGLFEYTIYSSCCNADKGIYYYTTYENSQITGVDMRAEDLDGSAVINYPLITGQQIRMQNR